MCPRDQDHAGPAPKKRKPAAPAASSLVDPLTAAPSHAIGPDMSLVPGLASAPDMPPSRAKHGPGKHGAKKREQRRLSRATGTSVSGTTHESEHAIGYEPLARDVIEPRGEGKRARGIEDGAPAYQEVKRRHREHIGTGSRGTPDESGFTADTYRDAQRTALEDGSASVAVQLNQLAYGQQGAFGVESGTPAETAADASFVTMVQEMAEVVFARGATDASVPVSATDRAEMLASRVVAKTGEPLSGPQKAICFHLAGHPDYLDA